jgi:protein SCO1/2/putative membrane protein
MGRFVAAVLAAHLLAGASAGQPGAAPFDSLYQDLDQQVPPFELKDQAGRTVTRDDLLGKVWVANFFFTRCAGDCSKTNAAMARLQAELADCPDVMLVGFSVDPRHDTPEVLRDFADRWKADPQRWRMLTGDHEAMHRLIQQGFLQAVQDNPQAKPGYEVIHTFTLMAVDREGRLRGYVDGTDPEQVPRVATRVRHLLGGGRAGFFPTLNADLNAACALLLALGYLAIRRRWVRTHKALMLSALAVSVTFLTSYLYFHLVVRHGEPTYFTGPAPVRAVYLGVLLSHTLLAVVVAPLALVTTYLGLTNRLGGHVRLARWTLPLWLYVSVTGVVVYVMLYQLYPAP